MQQTRLEEVRADLEAAEAKRNEASQKVAATAAAFDQAQADGAAAVEAGNADEALAARQRADESRIRHEAMSATRRRADGSVELARRQVREVEYRIGDLQLLRQNIVLDIADVERERRETEGRLEHCRARLDQLARRHSETAAELARLGGEDATDG